MKEALLTMNAKSLEAPEFLQAMNLLSEHFDLVSLTGKKEIPRERIQAAQLWVVVGGDGTLNRVVNALMPLPKEARPSICYLPFGTGNDFARTLGLGETPSVELLQSALKHESKFKALTVGQCNEQYFVNMASGGLFATVTTDASDVLKKVAGRWGYFFHGIAKLLGRDTTGVSINGAKPVQALGFFVGNARFAGGGVQITAEASPFHSQLEFLLVPEMPTADLLALGVELQKEQPDLKAFPVIQDSVEKLSLSFSSHTPINLDGEQVKPREAAFSVHPQAVRVFNP
jgi:diacylglycerol kinase (ATP)